METVKSMIELRKVLINYFRKRNSQAVITETNLIETDCLVFSSFSQFRNRDTFLFNMSITNYSTSRPFLTTPLPSLNSCLK